MLNAECAKIEVHICKMQTGKLHLICQTTGGGIL